MAPLMTHKNVNFYVYFLKQNNTIILENMCINSSIIY